MFRKAKKHEEKKKISHTKTVLETTKARACVCVYLSSP